MRELLGGNDDFAASTAAAVIQAGHSIGERLEGRFVPMVVPFTAVLANRQEVNRETKLQ